MADKPKKSKPTKADLRREVMELKAQLASTYHFADATLNKAGALMGSGVLVQLTALGGRELTVPFVIRDGFSAETIAALRADINRSYDLATLYKPSGVRGKRETQGND
jgi:hypothetical protein